MREEADRYRAEGHGDRPHSKAVEVKSVTRHSCVNGAEDDQETAKRNIVLLEDICDLTRTSP